MPGHWGEHFYDPDTKKWLGTSVSATTGKKLRRGFCQFVLGPIYKLIRGCVGGPDKREALHRHLEQLGIDITDASEEGEGLIKRVMANFLPLPDARADGRYCDASAIVGGGAKVSHGSPVRGSDRR